MNYAHVANGVVDNVAVWVADPGGDWVAVPAAGAGIGWSYASGVFAAPATPAPTLEAAQAAQIAALRQSQQTALAAGVAYNGNTYPLDATTQHNITSLAAAVNAAIPLTANPQLATTAGTFVTLTPADCTALAKLAINQVISVGNQLVTLIGQVMAATTVEAVQAITWPSAS